MLSYLYLNMYDCSGDIKEHYYVNKTISLERLARHFDNGIEEQNHNALDDAKLLKMVYEGIDGDSRGSGDFTDYLDPNRYPDEVHRVLRMQGETPIEEYRNIREAVEWIKKQPNDKGSKYIQNADEKIKYAAKNKSRYFGFNWRVL